jgi:hypothetical protein
VFEAVLDTTLCDKVCQWLAAGLWFPLGPPVSSPNKTDCHDITEILITLLFRYMHWSIGSLCTKGLDKKCLERDNRWNASVFVYGVNSNSVCIEISMPCQCTTCTDQ